MRKKTSSRIEWRLWERASPLVQRRSWMRACAPWCSDGAGCRRRRHLTSARRWRGRTTDNRSGDDSKTRGTARRFGPAIASRASLGYCSLRTVHLSEDALGDSFSLGRSSCERRAAYATRILLSCGGAYFDSRRLGHVQQHKRGVVPLSSHGPAFGP